MTIKEIIKDLLKNICWSFNSIFEKPEDKYFDWFLEMVKESRKTFFYWFYMFYFPFENAYQLFQQRNRKDNKSWKN